MVKIRQNFSRILEVFNRIPCKVLIVSHPLAADFKTLLSLANVNNVFDFLLLFTVNDHRWWFLEFLAWEWVVGVKC